MTLRPVATPDTASPNRPRATPLVYILDDEASLRQFLSLIVQGSGMDATAFADAEALRGAIAARTPDLVLLNVNLQVQDALAAIEALGRADFSGTLQLMSARGSAVLDTVRQAAEQAGVRTLPPLKKPFGTGAVQAVIAAFGQSGSAEGVRVELGPALAAGQVEFWYQPKVDLRKKQLVGAEAFARIRHPEYGVLTPASFMPDADEASVLALAELALAGALKTGRNLSSLGVELRIAINVPVGALTRLQVGRIVREHRAETAVWPGLMIDIPERQIIDQLELARELGRAFAEHNVRLAIDDFGKSTAVLSRLKELPFAEMKLDRAIVNGCGSDRINAPICKNVIDLAHGFGALAVGLGAERASDATALVSMGCDLGQGFLFGQPMPEARFIALLRQRVTVRKPAPALARAG